MKWNAASFVLFLNVGRDMGKLNRSENSLNQHIKLKHPELWDRLKSSEVRNNDIFVEDYEHDKRQMNHDDDRNENSENNFQPNSDDHNNDIFF